MAARVGFGPREWRYVLRRTGHSLIRTRLIDSAASLTFFAAITIFPGALAVLSAFALGRGDNAVIDVIQDTMSVVAGDETGRIARQGLEELTDSRNPGWMLAVGIVLLLSTASAYATAFGRAVNTFYGVQEGRRIWKFRALMVIVAAILVAGFAVAIPLLMGTPVVARAVGDVLGIGEPWITVWLVGRWPALIVLGSAMIALLYYWTPTIERQSVPLFSWGSLIALVGWGVATGLFVLYVSRFAHYSETYGWLGGALVLLLWLYLSNFVILLGAVLDAEIVRMRQLLDGIPSEVVIKVPMRDTSRNLVIARSLAADETEGREIREAADIRRHEAARHLAGPAAQRTPTELPAESEYRGGMSSERENPSETETERDFSVPEDADFTTPGDPIRDEDDEPRAATPGNPIANEPSAAGDYTTPGDPIEGRAHLAEERDGERDATPGNPLDR